jgi:hypothetical protein
VGHIKANVVLMFVVVNISTYFAIRLMKVWELHYFALPDVNIYEFISTICVNV